MHALPRGPLRYLILIIQNSAISVISMISEFYLNEIRKFMRRIHKSIWEICLKYLNLIPPLSKGDGSIVRL